MSFVLARILAFGAAAFALGVTAVLLADPADWRVAAAYLLFAAFSAALCRSETRRVRKARMERRRAQRRAQSATAAFAASPVYATGNWMPTLSSGQILNLYAEGKLEAEA